MFVTKRSFDLKVFEEKTRNKQRKNAWYLYLSRIVFIRSLRFFFTFKSITSIAQQQYCTVAYINVCACIHFLCLTQAIAKCKRMFYLMLFMFEQGHHSGHQISMGYFPSTRQGSKNEIQFFSSVQFIPFHAFSHICTQCYIHH